jgi:halimadienyl-diphosphate synthase
MEIGMNLSQSVCQLLKETGPGRMTNTAYDTAWIARLGEIDLTMSNLALDWLCQNQLPDGSWGTPEFLYYHDRVICTLAAIIALCKHGKRSRDHIQQAKGVTALERLTSGATRGLMADPGGSTVGFEMIMPTLLAEAQALGIIQNQDNHILGRLSRKRAVKIAMLQGKMISRQVTMAHSAEMAGPDAMHLLDIDNLQEKNGSIASNPAATAYFAIQVRPGDGKALDYLRKVIVNNGAPYLSPFDIYERAWVLWNLALAAPLDKDIMEFFKPHLDYLAAAWNPGEGVSFSVDFAPKDGDDTCISYELLSRFGYLIDLEAVLRYEEADHFRCFTFEANPSISANIHVLGALRQGGLEVGHPSIQKIINFVRNSQIDGTFWFDKWHASPYYATAHAVIACSGYADELVESAIDWILETQLQNGAWGFFPGMPTAEETAYCLQALALWQRNGHSLPSNVLQRAKIWLQDHMNDKYPPLWPGKCLYCPDLIVRSAILGALMLVDNTA